MKKLLFVLALGFFAACNNGTDADDKKDSTVEAIDSSASAAKDSVNATADSTKDMIDSSAAAAKDSVKH